MEDSSQQLGQQGQLRKVPGGRMEDAHAEEKLKDKEAYVTSEDI